jgi:hypothetical protein
MAPRAVDVRSPDAEDQARRRTRVLAIGLFALAMAELAIAIAAALASGISWTDAVGSNPLTCQCGSAGSQT